MAKSMVMHIWHRSYNVRMVAMVRRMLYAGLNVPCDTQSPIWSSQSNGSSSSRNNKWQCTMLHTECAPVFLSFIYFSTTRLVEYLQTCLGNVCVCVFFLRCTFLLGHISFTAAFFSSTKSVCIFIFLVHIFLNRQQCFVTVYIVRSNRAFVSY